MIAPMTASLTAPLASSLIQSVVCSLINAVTRNRVMGVGKRKEGRILSLLELPLAMKAVFMIAYNKMDHMNKNF